MFGHYSLDLKKVESAEIVFTQCSHFSELTQKYSDKYTRNHLRCAKFCTRVAGNCV